MVKKMLNVRRVKFEEFRMAWAWLGHGLGMASPRIWGETGVVGRDTLRLGVEDEALLPLFVSALP